jgi:hypothetical protein
MIKKVENRFYRFCFLFFWILASDSCFCPANLSLYP